MQYIIKDKKLVLQHSPGKGAWTYHLVIPNTKNIIGSWGERQPRGRLTKTGNRRMRYLLVEAAWSLLRRKKGGYL